MDAHLLGPVAVHDDASRGHDPLPLGRRQVGQVLAGGGVDGDVREEDGRHDLVRVGVRGRGRDRVGVRVRVRVRFGVRVRVGVRVRWAAQRRTTPGPRGPSRHRPSSEAAAHATW